MQELASILGVTPQAVMKHLKVLEKQGLIKSVELEGFGKQVVCLIKYVDASLYSDRSLESFSICVAKLGDESNYEIDAKNFAEALREIDDEIYVLTRRLRDLRNKEHRLHKKLIELYSLKQNTVVRQGLTTTDQFVMRILESKDLVKTAEEVAQVLNCSKEKIFELISKFKNRYLKEEPKHDTFR